VTSVSIFKKITESVREIKRVKVKTRMKIIILL